MEQNPTIYQPIGNNESLPVVTNAEKIIQANTDTRIIHLGMNHQPLKDVLKYVFSLIGLKGINYPNEFDTTMVLIPFIKDKLGLFTVADIKVAFQMAVAGELGEIDLKHYQTFNSIYLSDVMKAYKVYKNRVIAEEEKRIQKEKFSEELVLSDEEKQEIEESFWREMVVNEYLNFCQTEQITIMPISAEHVYKIMKKRGFINVTKEERKEKYLYFRSKLIESKMLKPIKISDIISDEDKLWIENNCYLSVIKDTFHRLKKENFRFE